MVACGTLPWIFRMQQHEDKGDEYRESTNKNIGYPKEGIFSSQPVWCWKNKHFLPTETVCVVVVH